MTFCFSRKVPLKFGVLLAPHAGRKLAPGLDAVLDGASEGRAVARVEVVVGVQRARHDVLAGELDLRARDRRSGRVGVRVLAVPLQRPAPVAPVGRVAVVGRPADEVALWAAGRAAVRRERIPHRVARLVVGEVQEVQEAVALDRRDDRAVLRALGRRHASRDADAQRPARRVDHRARDVRAGRALRVGRNRQQLDCVLRGAAGHVAPPARIGAGAVPHVVDRVGRLHARAVGPVGVVLVEVEDVVVDACLRRGQGLLAADVLARLPGIAVDRGERRDAQQARDEHDPHHGHEGEAGLGGAARAHWHFGPFPGSMGSAVRK